MNDERGFTLVELLVGMLIGMITILAAFQALDSYARASRTVTVRSDATQRARLAMDGLIRALRSQACKGPGVPSVLAGGPTSISFVTDLSDGSMLPEQRDVTFDAAGRKLTEARYRGLTRDPSTGVITFTTSPSSYGSQASDVERVGTDPIFRYYGYDTSDPPRPTLLSATLTTAELARVSRITVTFRVAPPLGDQDRPAGATITDEVLLRSVDPSDPVPTPQCS